MRFLKAFGFFLLNLRRRFKKRKKYGFMGIGWAKIQEKLSRIPGLVWQHFLISKERATSM